MARERKPRKTKKVRDLVVGDLVGGNNGRPATPTTAEVPEVFLPIVAIGPSEIEPGVPDPGYRVVAFQLPGGTIRRVRLADDLDAGVP